MRGFDQPIEIEENNAKLFDAAICMGNSLALAPDVETVQHTIRQMLAAVRPGGIVVIQVLNPWQLPDGPCVWQKCKKVETDLSGSGGLLILKGVHRCALRGYVEFLAASLADGKLLHHESVTFLGFEAGLLEQAARDAGAKTIHFFGDYKQHPYKAEKSPDLIMVAQR